MWLFQLFDYVIKALIHYKETPEGAKEWNDFTSAFNAQTDDEGLSSIFAQRTTPASSSPANTPFAARSTPQVVGDKPFVNTTAQES